MTLSTVARYNTSGLVETLPMLITPRYAHGCAGYVNNDNKMVSKNILIVSILSFFAGEFKIAHLPLM